MKKVLTAVVLLAVLAGCYDADITSPGNEARYGSPYVQLRYALASETSQYNQSGYTSNAKHVDGIIEVSNSGYHKEVLVHFSADGGWDSVAAEYYGPAEGNNELWSFSFTSGTYLPYWASSQSQFAISYTVNGVTVWDNNGGNDYVVGHQGRGMPVCRTALGKDAVKLVSGNLSPFVENGERRFWGNIDLKNLAFNKQVSVVYTTDNWQTVGEADANFFFLYNTGMESWRIDFRLPESVTAIEYVIRYTAGGVEYWDNNLGQNYSIEL